MRITNSFRTAAAAIAVCCAVLLLLALPATSRGYATEVAKWTLNRTVVMHLSLGGQQLLSDGFRSYNESAADALNTWNQYLTHMKFRPVLGSTLPPSGTDADTSVMFSKTVYGDAYGSRVLAVTLVTPRNHVLLEADVLFNSNESWDSYRGPQRSAFDFHRVALHEFGHVLGLDHPDQDHPAVGYVAPNSLPPAIMTSVIGDLDHLQPDDINGARFLYSNGPAYRSTVSAPVLANLSTRGFSGTNENVMVGGFIVDGSQPATIILRGIGHSLAAQGIARPLTDPVIEVRNSAGALISSSDDWIDGADAVTIASYGLDPTNSRESALLLTLNAGSYTVSLRGFDNGDGDLTGTGLIELYDLHTTGGRAANISTRGNVLATNDAMIAGFIIGGAQTKEVVVRALGPSLAEQGVANAVANPALELRDASGNLVRQNDDWANDPEAAAVQNSGLAPTKNVEAAIHVTLSPGLYTAIVRGNGGTGIGLAEVYDLSPAQ